MKKRIYLLGTIPVAAFVSLLFATSSCSNDFDVAAPWKEITLIYGLLDASKPEQFIRINKAYLDEETDAYVMAKNNDSLYHNGELAVMLRAYKLSGNTVISTLEWPLAKVNAADYGIVKDTGVFANNPYYLYYFNTPLKIKEKPDYNYKYEISVKSQSGNTATAETAILDTFKIIKPKSGQTAEPISLTGDDFDIRWQNVKNAFNYDVDLYFNYYDVISTGNGDTIEVYKSIKYDVIENFSSDGSASGFITYTMPTGAFFKFLRNHPSITNKPDNLMYRRFSNIDIEVFAGSEDLRIYQNATQAQFSITNQQIKPIYNNVKGGLGLFASRSSTKTAKLQLSAPSLDELGCLPENSAMQFAPSKNNPQYPYCQ